MSQGEVEVVRHSNTDLSTLGLSPEHCEAMQLLFDVKEGRRLVQQNYGSVLSKARSQQHTLPLATAERAACAIPMLPTVGALHGFPDADVVLFRFKPSIRVRVSAHCYELLCSEGKVRIHGLRQVTDSLRKIACTPLASFATSDVDGPAIGFTQTRKNIEHRAFTRSVDPDQSQELSGVCSKSRTFQNLSLAVREA
jgi:hypothetical protein